ncbi:hypothetical protein BDY21DRAFT_347393 [Lineolata rhizophorae]|uniref:COP9 signalosome complex subunit 6 n=1 Tax=Lineolata rhizophorae TaxID=578093 RepID=A0A6A6NXR9_9PEZI|nr:hypothetical protein BDY21DRAFT_347393 [Lineolata rhizophorae]
MDDETANRLISNSGASESSPLVQLHPLVLLTISDSITRRTLRGQEEPIVGAILGQQNGRDVTMEVAFECKLSTSNKGEKLLNHEWFNNRLDQFKTVHQSPTLDLVGWFTLGPPSGPQPYHLPLHETLQAAYSETALLLLFHPTNVLEGTAIGGNLPLTIYESLRESTTGGVPNSSEMEVEGPGGKPLDKQLRFRELQYSVETGEAEMIGMDFVARGGANAAAVTSSPEPVSAKGKAEAEEPPPAWEDEGAPSNVLSAEDEELLATLTAKYNAIKMLSRRLSLIRAYLSGLPPSYITDSSLPINSNPPAPQQLPNPSDPSSTPNYEILRSISALLARLPLLIPPTPSPANALNSAAPMSAFHLEALEQRSDVALTNLLNSMTSSIAAAKDLGRRHAVTEVIRQAAMRKQGAPGSNLPMGLGRGQEVPAGLGGLGGFNRSHVVPSAFNGGSGMDPTSLSAPKFEG